MRNVRSLAICLALCGVVMGGMSVGPTVPRAQADPCTATTHTNTTIVTPCRKPASQCRWVTVRKYPWSHRTRVQRCN
jgi:hypothetical protein